MFPNGWFKKEKPLPSIAAFGGGIGGLTYTSGGGAPGEDNIIYMCLVEDVIESTSEKNLSEEVIDAKNNKVVIHKSSPTSKIKNE